MGYELIDQLIRINKESLNLSIWRIKVEGNDP